MAGEPNPANTEMETKERIGTEKEKAREEGEITAAGK
jgi:hypothetical protein